MLYACSFRCSSEWHVYVTACLSEACGNKNLFTIEDYAMQEWEPHGGSRIMTHSRDIFFSLLANLVVWLFLMSGTAGLFQFELWSPPALNHWQEGVSYPGQKMTFLTTCLRQGCRCLVDVQWWSCIGSSFVALGEPMPRVFTLTQGACGHSQRWLGGRRWIDGITSKQYGKEFFLNLSVIDFTLRERLWHVCDRSSILK